MVSQLLANDKISFVCARNFTSRGKEYAVGDDFPQEDARDIEVFVRARYVIPVVENIEDKTHIRHWHREIRPKEEVLSRLARDRVQLEMPYPPDSDEVVNLDVLTHPETTPEPDEGAEPEPAPESEEPDEDEVPEGTIAVIKAWVGSDPDRAQRALDAELAGQNRSTLIDWLEDLVA